MTHSNEPFIHDGRGPSDDHSRALQGVRLTDHSLSGVTSKAFNYVTLRSSRPWFKRFSYPQITGDEWGRHGLHEIDQ